MQIDAQDYEDDAVLDEPTEIEGTEAPTPAPDEASTDDAEEQPASDVDETPEPEPDITEQVRKLRDTVAYQNRQIDRLLKRKDAPKLPDPVKDETAPKVEEFDTVEQYEEATRKWDIDRRVNEGIRKALEVDPNADIEAEREAFKASLATEGPKKYKDFETVISNPQLPFTLDLVDAVRASDNETVKPADIFYYLGKNPTEATRLSRMTPAQMSREIVKLENTLAKTISAAPAARQNKTVSDAPAPITPTDSAVIVTKDPDKMSQAEYEQWRREGGGR